MLDSKSFFKPDISGSWYILCVFFFSFSISSSSLILLVLSDLRLSVKMPGEEAVSRLLSAVLALVNITPFGKWIWNRNLLTFKCVSASVRFSYPPPPLSPTDPLRDFNFATICCATPGLKTRIDRIEFCMHTFGSLFFFALSKSKSVLQMLWQSIYNPVLSTSVFTLPAVFLCSAFVGPLQHTCRSREQWETQDCLLCLTR